MDTIQLSIVIILQKSTLWNERCQKCWLYDAEQRGAVGRIRLSEKGDLQNVM